MLLTLLDGGVYVVRHLFYTGPHKRDITINSVFAFLWLSAGLANIYPTFKGYSYACPSTSSPYVAQECITKLLFIIFGWIIGVSFIISSFLSYRLWSERREMYDGEWRVEALGDVVFHHKKYKHKPKPNITVKVNEPEQVMIYKSAKNSEKVTGVPSLLIQTATPRGSTSD
ncbi:12366_t:CDS:2 [Dentiscutata heterogama]|uniref:12366_t:CDS:1 n=1 Tax=Dentiscutata heterogama TaxID=1316150 RepID=A0ACA9K3I4_9GLOM|nr:12366_t:CDS:2 [Dentiscutata heterogama]